MLEMKHLLNVCADVKPTIRSSLNGMRALTFKKHVRVSSSRRDTLRSLCDSLGFGLAFETLNAFDALWKRLPSMKSGTSSETQVRDVLTVARDPDQMCLPYLSGIVPGTTNAKEDYEQIRTLREKCRYYSPSWRSTNTVAITSTVCAQALSALFHPFIQSIN